MAAKKVLVVGGGITGTVSAVALAQRGIDVTLVEISPKWHGVGHGITIQGNALKVFRDIGILDDLMARGHGFDALDVYRADGSLIARLEMPRTGGEDLPSGMGALRSDLQGVLVEKIRELEIDVRLGTQLESFINRPGHVDVALSGGVNESFDLVIAADGIKSRTRGMLGIPHGKKPTGLGIWRVVTGRTPDMSCAAVYYDGPEYKAGYTPISEELCYAYVLTDPVRPANGLSDAQEMKRLLEGYHGHFDFIRDSITDDDYLNFQPIEWLFVDPEPWHVGRVIVLGDAVHACPPLIAQGAAQCAEDAYVLAEFIARGGEVEDTLVEFTKRRKPRVRAVVEASMQLAEWELHPETPGADPSGLMRSALALLTQPA